MLDLLNDIGVQCSKDNYEFATKVGAKKLAKRIAWNIGITEERDIPETEYSNRKAVEENETNFMYDVSSDAKVCIVYTVLGSEILRSRLLNH